MAGSTSRRGRGSASIPRRAAARSSWRRWRSAAQRRRPGFAGATFSASVRGAEIADLGDFYRKVWSCGQAGAEIPVEIIRDGRALGLTIHSADRAAFLKRPRLQ